MGRVNRSGIASLECGFHGASKVGVVLRLGTLREEMCLYLTPGPHRRAFSLCTDRRVPKKRVETKIKYNCRCPRRRPLSETKAFVRDEGLPAGMAAAAAGGGK